ncbi:MAG: hypothetical protein ABMA01_16360 [Chthoniobacteraceae bacterium]
MKLRDSRHARKALSGLATIMKRDTFPYVFAMPLLNREAFQPQSFRSRPSP